MKLLLKGSVALCLAAIFLVYVHARIEYLTMDNIEGELQKVFDENATVDPMLGTMIKHLAFCYIRGMDLIEEIMPINRSALPLESRVPLNATYWAIQTEVYRETQKSFRGSIMLTDVEPAAEYCRIMCDRIEGKAAFELGTLKMTMKRHNIPIVKNLKFAPRVKNATSSEGDDRDNQGDSQPIGADDPVAEIIANDDDDVDEGESPRSDEIPGQSETNLTSTGDVDDTVDTVVEVELESQNEDSQTETTEEVAGEIESPAVNEQASSDPKIELR